MALGTADLQIVINAKDDASKTFGKVGKTIGKFSKLAVLGAGAAAVAAGAATVAAVKMAQGYEKAMAEVATLGVPVDQMKVLEDGVLDLSKRLGVDAVEATGALYQAISAGVPPENALAFLETASKAAIAGVTDAETAVDGITSVTNAFAAQQISATEAADILFATVKAGKTNFEELSSSIANVAPLAAATGVQFSEVAAALATMTASGTATSVATTQVRSAIQALTKPSAELTDIFAQAGFESGEAAVRQIGFAKAADIVSKATGGSVAKMTKLLGSIEGVQGVLGVTGDQAAAFAKNVDGMANSAGAADEAFEVMSQSFDFQMSRVRQAFKSGMIEFGMQILPILTPIAEMMANKLPGAIEMTLTPLKAFGSAMSSLKESASGFMVALDDLAERYDHGRNILGMMRLEYEESNDAFLAVHDVFPKLTAAMGVMNQGWIRFHELMEALQPSLEYLREAMQPIEQSFKTLGATVGFSFQTMLDKIQPLIPLLVNLLLPLWVRLLNLVGRLLPVLQEFGAVVIPVIVESINKLTKAWALFFGGPETNAQGSTMLKNLVTQGKELAREFGEKLVPVIRELADQFVAIIPTVIEFGKNAIDVLAPMVQRLFDNIEALIPTLETMWENFKATAAVVNEEVSPFLDYLVVLFQRGVMPVIESTVSLIGSLLGVFGRLVDPLMMVVRAVGEALLPVFTFVITDMLPPLLRLVDELIKQVERDVVPAFEEFAATLAETLVPAIKLVSRIVLSMLKNHWLPLVIYIHEHIRPAFVAIAVFLLKTLTKALRVVGAILRGDFTGALKFVGELIVHLFQGIAGALRGLVLTTIGYIKNLLTTARGFVKDVLDMVKHVPLLGGMVGDLSKGLDKTRSVGFGFAHGGQFTVGGAGGPDSQLVSFAATPGEVVTVSKPGGGGGGSGTTIVVQGSLVTERELSEVIVGTMREATRLNEDVLNVNAVTI